jgi:hypothetical protein
MCDLTRPQAKERVERLIQSAQDEGAKIILDGRGIKAETYSLPLFLCRCLPSLIR